MAHNPSDEQLDQWLRATPLPAGFPARLQRAVVDEILDEDLRRVPLPPGFAERLNRRLDLASQLELEARPATSETDLVPRTDAGVRRSSQEQAEVVLPQIDTSGRSESRRAGWRRRVRAGSRFVTAAALTILLGAVHFLGLAILLAMIGRAEPRDALQIVDFGPLDLMADPTVPPTVTMSVPPIVERWSIPPAAAGPLTIQLAGGKLASQTDADGAWSGAEPATRPGPVGDLLPRNDQAGDLWSDVSHHLRGLLSPTAGAGILSRRTSARHTVDWAHPAGHSRLFVVQDDAWPPLPPAANLQTLQIPVTTSTTSFDEACARAAEGRWPFAERVRSEEFVAAVSRATSADPDDRVTGRLTLSRGPLAGRDQLYLHVAIQAGMKLPERRVDDLHVTFTFDRDVVAAYRPLGYGSSGVDTLSATVPGDSLAAGHSAGILLEVWLHPSAAGNVAEVILQWRDPTTQRPRTTSIRPLSSTEATLFGDTPAVSQAAILAAETAAMLAEEPLFAWQAGGSSLSTRRTVMADDLLVACRNVDRSLARQPGFQQLVTLLNQLAALRSAREYRLEVPE